MPGGWTPRSTAARPRTPATSRPRPRPAASTSGRLTWPRAASPGPRPHPRPALGRASPRPLPAAGRGRGQHPRVQALPAAPPPVQVVRALDFRAGGWPPVRGHRLRHLVGRHAVRGQQRRDAAYHRVAEGHLDQAAHQNTCPAVALRTKLTANTALVNVPVVTTFRNSLIVVVLATATRCAPGVVSAADVRPVVAYAPPEVVADWMSIVTDVPLNAIRWKYACPPNAVPAVSSKNAPVVAAPSVRSPVAPLPVRFLPHSRPSPFASAWTAN